MRNLIIGFGLAISTQLSGGATAQTTIVEGYEARDLVSSEEIRRGGVVVEVDGIGRILITNLTNERRPEHPCLLFIPGLIAEIRAIPEAPRGATLEIELQALTAGNGTGRQEIICDGGGTGCTVTVEM